MVPDLCAWVGIMMVNNILVEKTSVAFGENITLYCNTSHAVPAPTFAFYINAQKVEEEENDTASYSFTVTQLHDMAKINCSAKNGILPFPVFSQSHVLTVNRKQNYQESKSQDFHSITRLCFNNPHKRLGKC